MRVRAASKRAERPTLTWGSATRAAAGMPIAGAPTARGKLVPVSPSPCVGRIDFACRSRLRPSVVKADDLFQWPVLGGAGA
jgi:hypothetical protein